MASPDRKKRRIADDDDFDVSDFPKCLTKQLVKTLQTIVVWGLPELTPLKILNCNAADGNSGISFSKAYCCIADESKKRFAFGDLFQRGITILLAFVEKQEMPHNREERIVLQRLLNYLYKKVDDFPGEILESLKGTELTTLLANHLFGELATSSRYIIDKHYAGKRGNCCLCGKLDCTLSGSFGDTSIGHEEVWHGNVDIIVNNELVVDAVNHDTSKTKQEDCQGGKSPVVMLKTTNLSRNPQIIAESIVYSFLQKQRHPGNDNCLTPCVGIGHSDMVVMFYDSKYDVLLESSPIPLLEKPTKGHEDVPSKINLTLVLISWLVVNNKFLATSLPDIVQEYKADFCTVAKNKMDVYENRLKFGNVGIPFVQRKVKPEIDRLRPINMEGTIRKMTDIYLQWNLANRKPPY